MCFGFLKFAGETPADPPLELGRRGEGRQEEDAGVKEKAVSVSFLADHEEAWRKSSQGWREESSDKKKSRVTCGSFENRE